MDLNELTLVENLGDWDNDNGWSDREESNLLALSFAEKEDKVDLLMHCDNDVFPESLVGLLKQAKAYIRQQEIRIRELERMAVQDALTGLMNRRGFEYQVAREMARLKRAQPGQCGVLVLIDLDDFKSVNDSYGHLAGDACLTCIAGHLQAVLREGDIVARLAGDEFALLLTDVKSGELEALIGPDGSLERRLKAVHVPWEDGDFTISASYGHAIYDAESDYSKVFSRADAALYAGKSGRKLKITAGA